MGNFTWNVSRYQTYEQLEQVGRGLGGQAAHSLYFTILSELGIAGGVIVGAILWYTRRDITLIIRRVKSWQQDQPVQSGSAQRTIMGTCGPDLDKGRYYAHAIAAGLLGYLISGVFLSVFTYPHFWIFVALTVGLKVATTNRLNEAAAGCG